MSSSFGGNLRVSVFGQSHSPGIGVVIEGLPLGFKPDFDGLRAFMSRRSPGGPLSTARKEKDEFEILSGLFEGKTCGSPLCCVIRNTDCVSGDYDALRDLPRPGHADYTAFVRYSGFHDARGGGHLSGRLTAPICFAGGLAMQLLGIRGVRVAAHASAIGWVSDRPFNPCDPELDSLSDFPIRVLDPRKGADMARAIEKAKSQGDSLSGEIECAATGLPAGIGDPIFDGLENVISKAVFAIPAVKGIEFGSTQTLGSANNDEFYIENGKVSTRTNHCGGILGGISNGMPIIFRVGVKPAPSIAMIQKTVNLSQMAEAAIEIKGRHDPCVVPRAIAAVEAAAALAVCDSWMNRSKDIWN